MSMGRAPGRIMAIDIGRAQLCRSGATRVKPNRCLSIAAILRPRADGGLVPSYCSDAALIRRWRSRMSGGQVDLM
jgi:hypothetical protein